MKAFLKFSLLLALIVVGKLAKQPAPAALAKAPAVIAAPAASEVTLVHQVFTSEPVLPQPPTVGPYHDRQAPDTSSQMSF